MEHDNIDKSGDTVVASPQSVLRWLALLVDEIRHWYLLFLAIFGLVCIVWAFVYAFVTPAYTAVAVIGPPNPSPINSMLSSMGGGGLGGIAKSLTSGSLFGGGNDPFQEYQQLLQSPRIAMEITDHDSDILKTVFHKRWDSRHNRWKSHGPLHGIAVALKRVLNRPVVDHPDANMLNKYFSHHLTLAPASSSLLSLANVGAGYMTVSLKLQIANRHKVEHALGVILARADETIRQEQLRDVLARITYIKNELPKITLSDQRQSLIQILANQEELQVMLVADKRFASILVSPPHASIVPTFPPTPLKALMATIVISIGFGSLLVWAEPKSGFLRKAIGRFRRARRQRQPSRSKIGGSARGLTPPAE